jgi:hypothetical protein
MLTNENIIDLAIQCGDKVMWINWFQQIGNSAIVLALTVASWGTPLPARAVPQSPSQATTQSELIRFVFNVDPPDRGTPPAGQGTGGRGDCLRSVDRPPLTRLVGSQGLDQTVDEHPTFWIYVPYTAAEAPSGEFSLHDGDHDVYRVQFQLPSTPGIVSVTLPHTVAPLEVDKSYRWYFEINCPNQKVSREPTPASVTGLVKRMALSETLLNELNAATTPLRRAAVYAKQGFWFDTLTELAQLRLAEPENAVIKQAWTDLLNDRRIQLQSVAEAAIVGHVTTLD